MLARIQTLIKQADPEVVDEWKWRGLPVWSHAGIICSAQGIKIVLVLVLVLVLEKWGWGAEYFRSVAVRLSSGRSLLFKNPSFVLTPCVFEGGFWVAEDFSCN